jgi:hypothetical protein
MRRDAKLAHVIIFAVVLALLVGRGRILTVERAAGVGRVRGVERVPAAVRVRTCVRAGRRRRLARHKRRGRTMRGEHGEQAGKEEAWSGEHGVQDGDGAEAGGRARRTNGGAQGLDAPRTICAVCYNASVGVARVQRSGIRALSIDKRAGATGACGYCRSTSLKRWRRKRNDA